MLLRKDAPVQRDGVLPLQHNQWARAPRVTTGWGQALGTPCLQGHRGVHALDDEDVWAGPHPQSAKSAAVLSTSTIRALVCHRCWSCYTKRNSGSFYAKSTVMHLGVMVETLGRLTVKSRVDQCCRTLMTDALLILNCFARSVTLNP